MTETFKETTIEDKPPAIFGNNGALHPNKISALGVVLPMTGMITESIAGTNGAIALGGLVTGGIADLADGKVARKWPKYLKSKEGARLDPLSDKIRNIIIFTYLLVSVGINPQLIISYIVNIGVDLISTLQRGSILKQVNEAIRAIKDPASCEIDNSDDSSERANWAGKIKTLLQTISGGALVGESLFRETLLPYMGIEIDSAVYQHITTTTLGVAAVLGAVGIYKKEKIKKELAKANA